MAVCFGGAAWLFSEAAHKLSDLWKRLFAAWWLRPVVAGLLVLVISWLLGTRDYMGLGVYTPDGTGTSIYNAFKADASIDPFGWFWKLLLTVITISAGFKGGEVTPLFFIGATLGHLMAVATGAPVDLYAGLGFVAVFAAATNTPVACLIMSVELFGAEWLPFFAVACTVAWIASGKSTIYLSQRLHHRDPDSSERSKEIRLADLR